MENKVWYASRNSEADYDEFMDMVIVAPTEEEAYALIRKKIVGNQPDEELCDYEMYYKDYTVALLDTSVSRVVLRDFNAG